MSRFISSGAQFRYLLDEYPNARMAYSVFKLRSAATLCMRVRRSSDNAEQDIGFVDEYIDTASLLAFAGAGNAFVVTWYDQSGHASPINMTMSITTRQPTVVLSGALEEAGGKMVVMFLGNRALTNNANEDVLRNVGYATYIDVFETIAGGEAIQYRLWIALNSLGLVRWGVERTATLETSRARRLDGDGGVLSDVPVDNAIHVGAAFYKPAANTNEVYSGNTAGGSIAFTSGAGNSSNTASATQGIGGVWGGGTSYSAFLKAHTALHVLWESDQQANYVDIQSIIADYYAA